MDKLRLKHLREDQKENLCKFWKKNNCLGCPLTFLLYDWRHCYKDVVNINKIIGEFWDTELNEKQTNIANDTFCQIEYKENKE